MTVRLSSGEFCSKYALFMFNFAFWLAGTGVLAVGLWLRFDTVTAGLFEGKESPTIFFTGVYILIAAGTLMMVVGFLGCYGAIKESPFLLGLYFLFLLIIFAVAVSGGTWGLSKANKNKAVKSFTAFYQQTYDNYKSTQQPALKEALRLIHFALNCCGPTGTLIDNVEDICPKKEGLEIIITTNCPNAIYEIFNSRLHIIGGVGIGIGVMISGMLFSIMLCCAIKRS